MARGKSEGQALRRAHTEAGAGTVAAAGQAEAVAGDADARAIVRREGAGRPGWAGELAEATAVLRRRRRQRGRGEKRSQERGHH